MNRAPHVCPSSEQMGRLAALPESDERRRALEECPRCAALLHSYRDFLEPAAAEPLPPGVREGLAQLRERLAGVEARPARTRARQTAREPVAIRWMPLWRPALAFAAVAVVAGAWWWSPLGPAGESGRAVRGVPADAVRRAEAEFGPDGAVRFVWPGVPEADHYVVTLHSAELATLARFEAGRETTLVVTRAELPAEVGMGAGVLFRVRAYSGGDEIGVGEARPLRAPERSAGR